MPVGCAASGRWARAVSAAGLLWLGGGIAAISSAQVPLPPAPDVLQSWELSAQLKRLQAWWPGEYDNHEQVVRQSGGGLSPEVDVPFRRVHSRVTKVDAPMLGPVVFLLESQYGRQPVTWERRELLVAATDVAMGAIRLVRHAGPGDQAVSSERLPVVVRPDEFRPLGPACDLLLVYEGEQFHGALAGDCPVEAGLPGYQVIVGQRVFWERSRTQGEPRDWSQGVRARPFTCNVFASADGDMAGTTYLQTIQLHDQGGVAELDWPDGRQLVFTIHTRAFSAASDRQYPLFRVHEKGNPVPIAYAYSVDQDTRFGLNLGWFYIRCFENSDMPAEEMQYLRK
jgi:hypothetical protein